MPFSGVMRAGALVAAFVAAAAGSAYTAEQPPPINGEHIPRPLTLEDLERIAMECNPTMVQARLTIRAAQGTCVQAGLYPNPRAAYIADEIGNDGTAGLQGAGISQEVVTAGKLRLGRAVAGHEIEQAQCDWEAQRWRVLNGVRRGYYEALLAQKEIDVNQQLVDVEQQILRATQQLRGAKEVSEVDVLQSRIEAENAQLNLSEVRIRYEATWRRLAAVLGRPDLTPAALAGDLESDLPLLNWEDSLAKLFSESPELARAHAGVQRAQCDLALQCAERVPNFEMGSAVKYDTGSRYTVVDVELGVPLVIFNRNQGNILRAQAALASAQQEVRRVELELRDRMATAFEEYAKSRQRAETYANTILPHARRSLELTTVGYREGEFAYLTMLTAQRTYYDTTLSYLSSLRELWAKIVEVEGLLLEGALQAPAGG